MKIFKNLLIQSRWLLLIPMLSLLLGAGYFAITSLLDIFLGLRFEESDQAASSILRAVDAALLSAALVIFARGLFELFISRLEEAHNKVLGRTLTIQSLDDLKDRLGKIIVLVLVVRFFDLVAGIKVDTMLEALLYAGAVGILALSLYFIRGGTNGSPVPPSLGDTKE
jgi:uncharacterized membrane protein YqhA